jgi:hypothetical protein
MCLAAYPYCSENILKLIDERDQAWVVHIDPVQHHRQHVSHLVHIFPRCKCISYALGFVCAILAPALVLLCLLSGVSQQPLFSLELSQDQGPRTNPESVVKE